MCAAAILWHKNSSAGKGIAPYIPILYLILHPVLQYYTWYCTLYFNIVPNTAPYIPILYLILHLHRASCTLQRFKTMCISLGGAARFSGHNVASVAEIFAARLPTNMQNMQEIRNLKFGLLCFSSPLPSNLYYWWLKVGGTV